MNLPDGPIQAIKFYREYNPDTSLSDCKRIVDNYRDSYCVKNWADLTIAQVQNFMRFCLDEAKYNELKAIRTQLNAFNDKYDARYYIDTQD